MAKNDKNSGKRKCGNPKSFKKLLQCARKYFITNKRELDKIYEREKLHDNRFYDHNRIFAIVANSYNILDKQRLVEWEIHAKNENRRPLSKVRYKNQVISRYYKSRYTPQQYFVQAQIIGISRKIMNQIKPEPPLFVTNPAPPEIKNVEQDSDDSITIYWKDFIPPEKVYDEQSCKVNLFSVIWMRPKTVNINGVSFGLDRKIYKVVPTVSEEKFTIRYLICKNHCLLPISCIDYALLYFQAESVILIGNYAPKVGPYSNVFQFRFISHRYREKIEKQAKILFDGKIIEGKQVVGYK